mgnify:CR=1 FL=1
MTIQVSDAIWGLVSAVVAELLKFFPALNRNELTRASTVIVVTFIAAYISNSFVWSWSALGSVLLFSFTSYKMAVQPMGKFLGSRTQH